MPQSAFSATGPTAATLDEEIGPDRAVWGARFLQPQTLGSVTRNTIAIYVRSWETICLIYILPLLPIAVLRAVLASQGLYGWVATLFLIQTLGSILVSAALTVAVSDICLDLKPNLKRAYRRGFANGRLLSTYFLLVLLTSLGFVLLVIPGLVLAVWYMFALSATVLEQINGRAAIRRSRELGRGFYWRNIGIVITCLLVVTVLLVATEAVMGISEYFLLGHGFRVLESILSEALSIVLMGPLVTIPVILLYYDMRARKEGFGAAQLVEDLRI
jgi:hypothetical protein